MSAERLKSLLRGAGITVNGPNPWDIQVHNEQIYPRIWREKSLGLGESYMDGWWDCERADAENINIFWAVTFYLNT